MRLSGSADAAFAISAICKEPFFSASLAAAITVRDIFGAGIPIWYGEYIHCVYQLFI